MMTDVFSLLNQVENLIKQLESMQEINGSYARTYRTQELLNKINSMGAYPLDILLVGATGVGKSSTINALFGNDVAKVGKGADPETMEIDHYDIGESKLRFWDSPGLGDSPSKDVIHKKKLVDTLYKTYTHDDGTWGLIDLVLVILDGSSRDFGTTYHLLEEVICQQIPSDRIITVVNQCDMGMKGRYWNSKNHFPEEKLKLFLENKVKSVQSRIYENTKQKISMPVYYSATENYNISKVMDSIIQHVPKSKRKINIS
ncbi:GTPase family protein [Psychrobacter sp. I-STPA6b]|uniref:GTPase family protein n=1 Tax=Psychrobacter sp. I-STPA6b TaxID=2585718 RepID=UPI001D0BFFA9|nr:GTPase [Psychrobacter sp. I-STPA6b]